MRRAVSEQWCGDEFGLINGCLAHLTRPIVPYAQTFEHAVHGIEGRFNDGDGFVVEVSHCVNDTSANLRSISHTQSKPDVGHQLMSPWSQIHSS